MKLRFRKYFNLQHKKVSRQAKLITLLLVLILFSAAILIVNKEVIHHRIYKAVGNTLQEWVYKETEGLYNFSYDSLSVNTLREQVTLKNVQLEIDSLQLEKLTEKPRNIYSLHSPRLFLDITSIWNVIFENKLDLKNIRVDSPSMTIFNLSGKDSTANLSMESGDLYLKLNQYLDEFKIEKFFLKSGDIVYKRVRGEEEREVKINDLDVYVDNLIVDAEKRTTGTDRVRVVLNEPSFMLADDIHKIQMDSLIVDSEYETIILNNVFVFPEYEKLKGSDLSEISLYNFTIPNIVLRGINFSQAYQDNILEIDKILIPNPEIIIDTHKKENGKASKRRGDNSLPILLSTLFNRISTNQLLINDASMDLAIKSNNKLRNLQVKNTSLSITGLDLDTIKYSKRNNHINYTKIDLELEDYQLILPDSIHMLKANRILYNSDSTNLKISDIEVYPKDPIRANDTINKYKITVPAITLEGFDIMEYLQTHDVSLTRVNVSQPEIVFHNQKRKDSVNTIDFNIALPNEKLANKITSEQILFDQVKFTLLQNNQSVLHFNGGILSFKDFLLTTRLPEKEKMFNSDDVKVSLASTKIYHKNFKNIEFSNFIGDLEDHSFVIKDLVLQDRDARWELEGQNIKLHNFKIKEFIEADDLELDILTIENASVVYNQHAVKKTSSEKSEQFFKLNNLKVSNGDFVVKDDKGMVSRIAAIEGEIQNIDVNNTETKVGDVKIKTGQIEHILVKDNLQIGAMSANITTNDLLLNIPYAKPIDYSLDNAISIGASQISLLEYDLYLLLNEQKLLSDELKILSTSFKVTNQNASETQNKKNVLNLNWQEILDGSLNEIKLARVIISGPQLALTVNDGSFTSADYQLELKKFDTSLDGENYLLNSNSVRVKVNTLSYEKEDIKLSADQFNFDENKKLITINNFSAANDNIKFDVPLVFAKQLNLRKLANEQQVIGDELELSGFKVTYESPEKNKTESKEDNDSDEMPFMSFKSIYAHQGHIKLQLKEDQVYRIRNVQSQLENFNTKIHKNQFLFSESVDLKASNISGYFNNNNDKVVISDFHLANSGKKITLDQVSLIPEHEKLKYAYEFGHETDWINMVLRKVNINNLDLNALIDENQLLIDNISANSLEAEVYRDKKLPEQVDKRTSLPRTALKNFNMQVNIDTVNIKSADITYQELGELAFEPGELNFNNLDIWISNITNMPSIIREYNKLIVHTQGEIEGTEITATASFDLTSENDEFRFAGRMGEGSLTKFNNILEKNTFLRIDKGHSRGLSFSLKADNDRAAGDMKFYYKNLKVSLLDKKTNKSSGLDESLASFFANTFVINSNNPRLFVLKEGDIYFKRDKSKSLLNYWAKSFLSGVVSSIGVQNNKKEAEEALQAQD